VLSSEIGGTVQFTYAKDGLRCVVTAPMSSILAAQTDNDSLPGAPTKPIV
jgi:hypothetical protein